MDKSPIKDDNDCFGLVFYKYLISVDGVLEAITKNSLKSRAGIQYKKFEYQQHTRFSQEVVMTSYKTLFSQNCEHKTKNCV